MEKRFYKDNLYSSVRITHIHYAKVERGWSYGDDRHNLLEFKYCAVGSLRMWIDGEYYELQAGDAVIVKPGMYHRTEPVEEISRILRLPLRCRDRAGPCCFSADEFPVATSCYYRWAIDFHSSLGGSLCDGIWGCTWPTRTNPMRIHPLMEIEGINQSLMMLRAQSRLLEFIGVIGQSIVNEAQRTARFVSSVHR